MLDFYSGAHAQVSGAQLMWRADVVQCAPNTVNSRLTSTLVEFYPTTADGFVKRCF
ncbi:MULTISPECIES: hypothetical protein [Spiribacter]|uniref:hypothetical protein n=1 Tax=Spiribacter TaxID=1335745 RepID=UPI001330D017|nr:MULTISPECIES: hypothetical protein [Spiribacter]